MKLTLGQHRVNIAAFCKEYNARTRKNELIILFEISVCQSRCYTFLFKIHSASSLLTPNRINDKLVINIKLGEKTNHINININKIRWQKR